MKYRGIVIDDWCWKNEDPKYLFGISVECMSRTHISRFHESVLGSSLRSEEKRVIREK